MFIFSHGLWGANPLKEYVAETTGNSEKEAGPWTFSKREEEAQEAGAGLRDVVFALKEGQLRPCSSQLPRGPEFHPGLLRRPTGWLAYDQAFSQAKP